MNTTDTLAVLAAKLEECTSRLSTLDAYWTGTQPAAFLSPDAADALGDRLRVLAVNYPRLAVTSLGERLSVTGFRVAGPDSPADPDLWRIWRANGMGEASAQAHVDALALGRSFVIVWAGTSPEVPRITVESPRQVTVLRDPASRTVTAALKLWNDASSPAGVPGTAHAIVYEPDKITRYASDAPGATVTGWRTDGKVVDNPLGVVPVVPIVNRGRLLDLDGVSEMSVVLDLADALNKLMSDAMVTSEYFARPRRWVTGMEIVEDEDGNPVNPFSDEMGRVWQSEDPATKFGQFDPARLDTYSTMVATITQQIGALTGLPPHYLGLNGDQPAAADAIRSAEASLTARAYQRQRTFGQGWDSVAALTVAVRDGVDPASVDAETIWANPETRTPAQSADAAAKLVSIGMPLTSVLADPLGYTPEQIEQVRKDRRTESVDTLQLGNVTK